MAGLTQRKLNYIEDGFFNDTRNTSIGFDRISAKYGTSGFDEVIKMIGPRIPKESFDGKSVYSFPGKASAKYGNDFENVEKEYKKGKTWYDITRRNKRMSSAFVNIE